VKVWLVVASQGKNKEIDHKETKDRTAVTATSPESNSGTTASDEDDQVWSAPLV
jgi:hypothetical protein